MAVDSAIAIRTALGENAVPIEESVDHNIAIDCHKLWRLKPHRPQPETTDQIIELNHDFIIWPEIKN